ncbi:MAG: DUF2817 domain-containing protein [Bacteriovoracaceae bacterium]
MENPTLNELQILKSFQTLKLEDVEFKTIKEIEYQNKKYPIQAIIVGSQNKNAPTLGLFGGVHGLEKIGSQVILAYFHSLFQQLHWDKNLREEIKNFRIVSIPIINPAGMARLSRSNPNNVDLMRNAPVEAQGKVRPLISGHRLSSKLPWYRGEKDQLEEESLALINFVKEEMFQSKASLALDVHSGFGMQDQLWYPYAKQKGGFPLEAEALELKSLLDKTYPNHIYKFEAQSLNYLTHGDLWDYIFDLPERKNFFLPLTLELGSWNWVRKNPIQLFSKFGLFHPIKGHRHARIMRRHLVLLNFLLKAINNHEAWTKK